MIYNFLALADIHWGTFDSEKTYQNLQLVLDFIRECKNEIDFVVICGDYFDYRLQLNSRTALLAVQWMDEFTKTCKVSGVKKIRIVKGTREHDNDQLEVFRPMEDNSGYFKIFNTTTREDLFDDLSVVYCPDENINLEDYDQEYWYKFMPPADIGFFHGNWDNVLPTIEFNRIQTQHLPNMIYQYDKFSHMIKGPMISGHWHIPTTVDSLYYIGSFDRWKFDEEEPKGFIYGSYNTQTSQYYIHRVENINAPKYISIYAASEDTRLPIHFAKLKEQVKDIVKEDPDMKLRVVYLMNNQDEEARENFLNFQKHFSNSRQIKVTLKDLYKKEQKKKEKIRDDMISDKFNYIYSSDVTKIPSIIHQFIIDKNNQDVPLETIEKYVGKYLKEL